MYTYEQLRRLAVQSGIPDNKVSIGFWIKSKGLKRIKKQVDKIRKIYYVKDDNSSTLPIHFSSSAEIKQDN